MRREKLPIWAWRLMYWERRLQLMLDNLEGVKDSHLTGFMLHNLGIEIHELDFWTGATCSSAYPFFTPEIDNRCKIGSTMLDPYFPGHDPFTLYRRMREEGINRRYGLQAHLASSFKRYAEALTVVGQPEAEPLLKLWKSVPTCAGARASFHSKRGDPYSWDIIRAAQVSSKKPVNDNISVAELLRNNQCHRQVWMYSDDYPVKHRPSVSELRVLISWMLAAMKTQRKLTATRFLREKFQPHHIFPTLIVSFMPRAQARVLYGYFDGTFEILMTKPQEFDVPHYVEMMDGLLKWAWPRTFTQTRRIFPPATITESSAENETPVEDTEKEGYLSKWLSRIVHKACARKKSVTKVAPHVCEYPGQFEG